MSRRRFIRRWWNCVKERFGRRPPLMVNFSIEIPLNPVSLNRGSCVDQCCKCEELKSNAEMGQWNRAQVPLDQSHRLPCIRQSSSKKWKKFCFRSALGEQAIIERQQDEHQQHHLIIVIAMPYVPQLCIYAACLELHDVSRWLGLWRGAITKTNEGKKQQTNRME